jgi:hypothetical protein
VSTAAVAPQLEQDPQAIGDMMQKDDAPRRQQGQDPTTDDPNQGSPEENAEAVQLTEDEKEKVLWLRREFKSAGRHSAAPS